MMDFEQINGGKRQRFTDIANYNEENLPARKNWPGNIDNGFLLAQNVSSKFSDTRPQPNRSQWGDRYLESYPHILHLPSHILIRVLQHVNNRDLVCCLLVCSQFYDLVSDARCWRGRAFVMNSLSITKTELILLLNRGIEALALYNVTIRPNDLEIELAGATTFPLRLLSISSSTILRELASNFYSRIIESCPNLESLNVRGFEYAPAMALYLNRGQLIYNLSILSFNGCRWIDGELFHRVLVACNQIRRLDMCELKFCEMPGALLQIMDALPPSLTHLNAGGYSQLSSSHLEKISERCRGLQFLACINCESLTFTGSIVEQFLNLQHLKVVRFDDCPSIKSKCMEGFVRRSKSIEEVSFTWHVPPESLERADGKNVIQNSFTALIDDVAMFDPLFLPYPHFK